MSRPAPLRSLALLLVVAAWLPACASTVPIPSVEPGPVAVAGARHLVVLDGVGPPDARETVFLELARQTHRDGWFTVDDLSADGRRVVVAGRRVAVRPDYPLEEDAAGLRIDVLVWRASSEGYTRAHEDGSGALEREEGAAVQGSVVLAVTLFDAWGRALVAEREYAGAASGPPGEVSPEEAIGRAASAAVAEFLTEVSPRRVLRSVRLDEGDPGQADILELAEAGSTAAAAERLAAYAARHPDNAAAAYNMAVLLDALGEGGEAIAWYDRAVELGGRSYYDSARAACVQRMAGGAALRATPPPAARAP